MSINFEQITCMHSYAYMCNNIAYYIYGQCTYDLQTLCDICIYIMQLPNPSREIDQKGRKYIKYVGFLNISCDSINFSPELIILTTVIYQLIATPIVTFSKQKGADTKRGRLLYEYGHLSFVEQRAAMSMPYLCLNTTGDPYQRDKT